MNNLWGPKARKGDSLIGTSTSKDYAAAPPNVKFAVIFMLASQFIRLVTKEDKRLETTIGGCNLFKKNDLLHGLRQLVSPWQASSARSNGQGLSWRRLTPTGSLHTNASGDRFPHARSGRVFPLNTSKSDE